MTEQEFWGRRIYGDPSPYTLIQRALRGQRWTLAEARSLIDLIKTGESSGQSSISNREPKKLPRPRSGKPIEEGAA